MSPNYGETVYGGKYEATKSLSTTDIAKRVREDIKALVAQDPKLQGLKVSVRSKYYSGGSSIDVEVTALPKDFKLLRRPDPASNDSEDRKAETYNMDTVETSEARALRKALQGIVADYNYDGSDIQVDYFHVRFYSHVRFAYELEEQARQALGIGAAA